MYNNSTVALLAIIAALSVYGGINQLMRRYPFVATVAAFEIAVGSMFIYIGCNTHIIL